MAPFLPLLISNRVPHGLTQDPSTEAMLDAQRDLVWLPRREDANEEPGAAGGGAGGGIREPQGAVRALVYAFKNTEMT